MCRRKRCISDAKIVVTQRVVFNCRAEHKFATQLTSHISASYFFVKWPSNVIHTPNDFEGLLSCSSSDKQVCSCMNGDGLLPDYLVPSSSSPPHPRSICRPDAFSSSFHALAMVWSSLGDIAMTPAIVREKQQTQITASHGQPPSFVLAHITKLGGWRVQGCSKKVRRARITLWHRSLCDEFPGSQFRGASQKSRSSCTL